MLQHDRQAVGPAPLDARYTESTELLESIGPQRADEPVLARRVRFHQSWYRAVVLGIPRYGETVGASPRRLGSILTDADAADGHNFASPSARRLYEQRRSEGWGVEPIRCTKYLTSSQTLTLNLFGPLVEAPNWAARTLVEILRRPDIEQIGQIWVEFAPRRRKDRLNDMTRIDALIAIRTSKGDELLAVEIKYSDRFNSRRVDIDRAPYKALADSTGLWRDANATLLEPRTNQLVRCHALAAAMSKDLTGKPASPQLLVLHHSDDLHSRALIENYREQLTDPALVQMESLDNLVGALKRTARSANQRAVARQLELRYVAESESDSAWQISDDRSVRARRESGQLGSKQ